MFLDAQLIQDIYAVQSNITFECKVRNHNSRCQLWKHGIFTWKKIHV